MTRGLSGRLAAATFSIMLIASPAGAAGDPDEGEFLANKWCSACHLINDDQQSASADAPTFRSIAVRYGDNIDVLAGFLIDPHPPMPNMSLTRREIQNLLAYIETKK